MANVVKVNQKDKSTLEYPPIPGLVEDMDKDKSTREKKPLGKNEHDLTPPDKPNKKITGCGFIFEIVYPTESSKDCKNKIKQFVKSTTSNTFDSPKQGPVTSKTEFPAGDPSAQPNPIPGGFDHPGFGPETEDKNLATGENASQMITGSSGTESGYVDNIAVNPSRGARNPSAVDAKVRIELRDCNDKLIEWVEFEIHVAINKAGTVTKAELTGETHGTT